MKIGVNKNKELRAPQRQNSSKSGLSCGSRANATRVRVTLVGSGGDLAVSVTDDGSGIADPGVLLPALEAGRPLDAATLRTATTRAFGTSDAEGDWVWKDAYEAGVVLFVRRYGRAMRRQAGAREECSRRMLAMLDGVATLEPSHTKRSEDQVRLQQLSTPLPLDYAAFRAAAIRPGDVVLEPSAGTGMPGVMAQCALGSRADAGTCT